MTNDDEWTIHWLKSVQAGLNTMSQRKLTSIEKYAGSLEDVKRVAERMGVHLLLVEDDEGHEVVGQYEAFQGDLLMAVDVC